MKNIYRVFGQGKWNFDPRVVGELINQGTAVTGTGYAKIQIILEERFLVMKCRNNVDIIHWNRIEVKCKHKEYFVQMHFFCLCLSHTVIVVWK